MSTSESLMFLPGAGADPEFWRPVGNHLPQEWSKFYVGWPGLGHNAKVGNVDSFEDLVRFTEAHLPSGRSTLVAQSFGGTIALALALRRPERVKALVLCTAAAGMDLNTFGVLDWRPSYREEYPDAAEWLYTTRLNFEPHMPNVKQPTLLIWGNDDPISPVAVGQRLQTLLPNATLHVIDGGTHALALERAKEVAQLVHTHVHGHTQT